MNFLLVCTTLLRMFCWKVSGPGMLEAVCAAHLDKEKKEISKQASWFAHHSTNAWRAQAKKEDVLRGLDIATGVLLLLTLTGLVLFIGPARSKELVDTAVFKTVAHLRFFYSDARAYLKSNTQSSHADLTPDKV